MTTISWAEIRARAVDAFNGELPNAHTEQEIIDAFTSNPNAVIRAIDEVADQVAAGKARSGWAILRHRANNVHAKNNPTATLSDDRENAIRLAEAWIRNAGIYEDQERGLLDALFYDIGARLEPWANDELLRRRMVDFWRDQRPRGEKAEREELERAAGYVEHRKTHPL